MPVDGVDREAIAQSVAPLVPVGWTPIALSLQRAEADFPNPAEGAANAVVLVTDGLETCGGDPAAAAGALASGEKGIVTHVIGFAVTAEEQQILEGITAASGGMLLGANNATELSGALFAILDELDVVKGAGFIGGNALSLLPQGESGVLSVVAVGAYDGNTLPFVVRNNTGETVISLEATGRALNPAGQLIATGGDQLLHPNLLRAGGLSLGYVYFGGAAPPPTRPSRSTWKPSRSARTSSRTSATSTWSRRPTWTGAWWGRCATATTSRSMAPSACRWPASTRAGRSSTSSRSTRRSRAPTRGSPRRPGAADRHIRLPALPGGRGRLLPLVRPAGLRDPDAGGRPGGPGPGTSSRGGRPAAPQGAAAFATPDAGGCHDLGSAMAVVSGLAAQGLPVGELVEYTAETDPNELLGRPGGYTSKVNFRDARLDPESADFDVQDGGAVEVFATPEDLEDRVARLEASWEAFPLLDEDVLFTHESVLVRVSTRLLTADSDAYGAALREIAACP